MWNDLIGKPFQDGGRGPESYDCWGLAREVYRRFGKILPDYQISCTQAEQIDGAAHGMECKWQRLDEPMAPCLLIFSFDGQYIAHMGVYVGKGKFLHAREKVGVAIERIEHPYWKRHLKGFYKPRG